MSGALLTADYASPSDSNSFAQQLPALPRVGDVREKTAYLSALRSGITEMQADVNAFLTKKMEQDKAAESGKAKTSDEKAEEMYGEEEGEEAA